MADTEIRFEDLSVRRNGVSVLEDVNLQLPLAARTVVIGPNGAGKTTLMLAAFGLLEPASGSIRCRAADGREVAARYGFVFQKAVMLRRSAMANIEHALAVAGVARHERHALAREALVDVGLEPLALRPARRLSGGEQQRLAIARANALRPDCLLLDEPTAHLDPAAATAIERYLLRLSARGCGLLMATHDLGQARRLAERVVFLHRGRIHETGDASAFFSRPSTEVARRFISGEWLE